MQTASDDRTAYAVMAQAASVLYAEIAGLVIDEPGKILGVVQRFNELLSREARRTSRRARDRVIQLQRAAAQSENATAPTPERALRGDLDYGDSRIPAPQRIVSAQYPIERYLSRGDITTRQANGAARFRDDYHLGIVGAHNPEAIRSTGSRRTYSFTEAQKEAADDYAYACARLGQTFTGMVEQVVIAERMVDDIARQRVPVEIDGAPNPRFEQALRTERQRLFWALKAGLDILGDFYGEPAEVIGETIIVDPQHEVTVKIEYRHEKNGTVSGVRYNGMPWLASAPNVKRLYELAVDVSRGAAQPDPEA